MQQKMLALGFLLTVGACLCSEPVVIQPCSKRIKSRPNVIGNFDIVAFSLPRFARTKRVRDIDYQERLVGFGPAQDQVWLKFMLGPFVGGDHPDDLSLNSIRWAERKLVLPDGIKLTDWKGIGPEGRVWRHLQFPFGFASYKNAPPKAAKYFDRILDSLCCIQCS